MRNEEWLRLFLIVREQESPGSDSGVVYFNHELRLSAHELTFGHELHCVHELPCGA